eukprot:10293096-Karenia_brevis.AAC.1
MDLDDELLDTLADALAGDEPHDTEAGGKEVTVARVKASLQSKRKRGGEEPAQGQQKKNMIP